MDNTNDILMVNVPLGEFENLVEIRGAIKRVVDIVGNEVNNPNPDNYSDCLESLMAVLGIKIKDSKNETTKETD